MNSGETHLTAVVLAAGNGSRMQSTTAKQFLMLKDKPILWYSLQAMEKSLFVDQCIIVVGAQYKDYVQKEIVDRYGFKKVIAIVEGGKERYESVANALRYLKELRSASTNGSAYILIHDGARPFLSQEILQRTYEAVQICGACVAAMPSKDTVKIADSDNYAIQTPNRKYVWSIQTPQVFEAGLITCAYEELDKRLLNPDGSMPMITDDAGVVECFTGEKVKLVEGSYKNIKITTPEDMLIAEAFLQMKES